LSGEITALRDGERSTVYLYHQDDPKLFKLIEWLMQQDPNKRPYAAQALQFTQNRNHTSEQQATKKFLVRRHSDETLYRCSSSDYKLSNIQAAIEGHRCFGINKNNQILRQEKTIQNQKRMVGLTTDEDAREMFESAEAKDEKAVIVVSERNSVSNSVAKKL
jgi:hypothetical protein